MELTLAAVPIPTTLPSDTRIGQLLIRDTTLRPEAKVALIGFPSEQGIVNSGGRPGAAAGPDAIRHCLYRLTPDARNRDMHIQLLKTTQDLGNLAYTANLAQNQAQLGKLVAECLAASTLPIVLGGGQEAAYGHFLGYTFQEQRVGLINLDAHTDVRENGPHSGSAFRQALEHPSKLATTYHVAGLQPYSVTTEHLAYVQQHGTFCWAEELDGQEIHTIIKSSTQPTLVSLDLDVVNNAEAPGVSSPSPTGITGSLFLHAAHEAGITEQVTSLDITELSPPHDHDNRTARLAALAIWEFLTARSHLLV